MFAKTYSLSICILISLSLFITSCKKDKDSDPVNNPGIDKTISLNSNTTSAKDTLYVKRDKATALFKISVKKAAGVDLKRLYVFKRILDPANTGDYETLETSGFLKDGNNNYYFPIPAAEKDTTSQQVTVNLRVNDFTAVIDELYFVYTTDADYTGPSSTIGVIIGPARFFVIYGKLTEYNGIRIYNAYTANANYKPGVDLVNMLYKTSTDAAADIDIFENTDSSALFLGKFKSLNSTSFVKAPSDFPYSNATDLVIAASFEALSPSFTVTPDSVKIGDIYLIKLRGDDTKYAAMKVFYVTPENGLTGSGYDNEYMVFNVRK